MAKAAKSGTVEVQDPLNPDVAALADADDAEDGDLFRAIDEISATEGVKILIIRRLPADKAGFVGEMTVSEFSLTAIKDLFGSGTYRVRIKGPTGFLKGGGTVNIAAPNFSAKPLGTGAASDLSAFLEIMERKDAAKAEKFNAMLLVAIPAAASVLTAMMGRQSGSDVPALIAALKPAPGPTMQDLTQTMVNLKALSGEKGGDPVETVLKIMERVKDLGSENSAAGGSNWLDVARDVLRVAPEVGKSVLEGISRAQQQRQPVATVAHPAPSTPLPAPAPVAPTPSSAPASAPSVTSSQNTGSSEMDMLQMFMPVIKAKLSQIAGWAEANKNPILYANLFFDELPANIANYIPQEKALEYLNNAEWFKYVVKEEPRLAPFEKWATEFRAALLEIMEVLDDEDEPKDDITLDPPPPDEAQSGS